MLADTDRAINALYAIPADLPRDEWVRAGMAAHAAGLNFDTFNCWSAQAQNYSERDASDTFRSFKPGKGVGIGTLYRMAAEHGWNMDGKPQHKAPAKALPRPAEVPRKPPQGMSPAEVWERCEPVLAHAYIAQKSGVPAGLRVVPADDPLQIKREPMAGALVVPAYAPDGTLQSLQLIAPPDTAARLKAANKPGKLNLPNAPIAGATFTVGPTDGPAYLCEGIGQAWSCWQATRCRAVVCFGWNNVRRVAESLRKREPSARLVLVPDVGKEADAERIAKDVRAAVAAMPQGEAQNFDANDLMQRDDYEALKAILEAAQEPAPPEPPAPRYRLLTAGDLRALPALAWRVRGVLPAVGLAALYGPSASGKSFLGFDMAAAIAEGLRWFDCRVEAAPVVYAALEGEAGFKLRAQAWEASRGHALPAGLHMVLQPFRLTEPQDVHDLAAVVPAGAVVFLDTLNRAAPTADENSSKDMGEILSAAKHLQSLISGLVVLVHHTGKDATKGLRGHSSLYAALDAAVEVSRDGERREWKVAKSKDGQDGYAQPFKLQIETLGTDDYGDAVTSCVVVRDNTAQDVRAVKVPQGGNQQLVWDALRPMFKDGTTGMPGAPPLHPCIELEAVVRAGASRMTCATDKRTSRARDAIAGLVARGLLGLKDGFLWMT